MDADHHLRRHGVEPDRDVDDEAVRQIDRRQHDGVEADAGPALGALALDAKTLERPGILLDVGLLADEQQQEQCEAALGAADPVEVDGALDQGPLLRFGPVAVSYTHLTLPTNREV